jgi:sugar phosphate isomerase/epimerase
MSRIQWLLFASTPDLEQYGFIVKVLTGNPQELCERSIAWGYDGFEFLPDPLNIPDAEVFLGAMRRTGAVVPVVNTGRFSCQGMPLLVTDRAARRRSIEAFKGVLEFAGGIGARVGLGASRGKCRNLAEAELAGDCFRELSEHAVRCGTVIMLEAVEAELTSFVNTMDAAMHWVTEMNSPGFSAMLDTHQLAHAEPSIEHGIRAANGAATHIHFYDPSRWPPGVVPPSQGLDWPRVMRVLAETGFQGTGSVVLAPEGDVEAAARTSVAFLRRTLSSANGATQNGPSSPQTNIANRNPKGIFNA